MTKFVLAIVFFASSLTFSKDAGGPLQPSAPHLQELDFSSWLVQQERGSWEKLLANISPSDALRGVVVASPSRHDPDYYYDWVRDGALVMNNIVSEMREGSHYFDINELNALMLDYLSWVRTIQPKHAPTGLGEPKYFVDGRPYDLPWGRPQNDGPALRAITLMNWAELLWDAGHERFVLEELYSPELPAHSPIKRDLEYVSHNWQHSCFDLWEEVMGEHFYTRMTQLRALRQGARFATRAGDEAAARWYAQQADQITWVLSQHFSEHHGYIVTTLGSPRSGLDVATVLALLHTFDPNDPILSFSNDWVLSTVAQLERAFENVYTLNHKGFPAVAIGRYPEDVYYGGNPWFLATHALAEFYYRLRDELGEANRLEITARNVEFFERLLGAGKLTARGFVEVTPNLLAQLQEKADSFLKRSRIHIGNKNIGIAEQYHRDHGYQLAARDLTWSYASFLTAVRSRQQRQ